MKGGDGSIQSNSYKYTCSSNKKEGEGSGSSLGVAGKSSGGRGMGKRVDCASHGEILKGLGRRMRNQENREFEIYVEEAYMKANRQWLKRSLIACIKVLRSIEFVEAFILSQGAKEVTVRWLESDYLLVSCQSKEAARNILENGCSW